jgi:arylsulfatase A-like enzyme
MQASDSILPPDMTRITQVRPGPVGVLLLGLLSGLSCADSEGGGGALEGANLVLVVIDTLRADHLGTYGHDSPTSPRIDELAEQSLVFDCMYSQAPWTKPSIASLFTSLQPSQHRVVEEGTDNQLSESLITLAEVLSEAGYRTCGVSQNPHIQSTTGFAQGFGEFIGLSGQESGANSMFEAGRDFLDQESEEPFFLYLHFLDPHGPYAPPPKLREKFVGNLETTKRRVASGRVGMMLDGEVMLQEFGKGDLAYLEALYDAEIRWVDNAVGRLLDHMEAKGLDENTVVILTADHGEEFLDHGTVKHGYHVYEESVHVPLIIRMPDGRVGRDSTTLVQHIDLMPTALELLSLEGPSELQGRSLGAALEGEGGGPREVVLTGSSWRGIERFAVRRGEWKLVCHVDESRTELFHLGDDPGEQSDVAAEHPGLVQELMTVYLEGTRPIAGVTPEDAMGTRDLELERRLQAIGYTGVEAEDE